MKCSDAIARNDQPYLVDLFKEFYINNPGLYSVQWVDEKLRDPFRVSARQQLK